jgi:hypothetical protein
VGEDLARAGLAGRHRISGENPACRRTSTRSASTSSAMAAPPASATPARCRTDLQAINDNDLVAAAVLSGNRNFEGRVNPDVRRTTSPRRRWSSPMRWPARTIDITTEPLGTDKDGKPVYLKDIWPTSKESPTVVEQERHARCSPSATPTSSRATNWQAIKVTAGATYAGTTSSTYVQNPPYFEGMTKTRAASPTSRRARPRPVRRQDHHRPHLAGRLDQGRLARRQVPDEHRRRRCRLQPVRHAPRQPRSDDARHLRQHPHQERDGGRQRREGGSPSTIPTASRCRSTTRRCATRRRARRW